ncbi:AcrR family transcriptional regulator [Mycobacterium sp. MAA66]|uniref:TetR/AcrR family transcriptional regulator n=1 Tax=Mycobacterium sp. MAA66 TaxID=3156297 RepID=UPI00351779E8
MSGAEFQRARSPQAKQQRYEAILDAAQHLGAARGVSQVTLTEIAEAVGMHKSAMLRYFETREEIFLQLTATAWQEWSRCVRHQLTALQTPAPADVADVFAETLTARGFFCDLLAQTPLHLERNVSVDAVRGYKLIALAEFSEIVAALRQSLPALSAESAGDAVATATSLAGSFWHIATPGPEVAALYRSDPQLAHAIVEIRPRLTRILTALLDGML